ncbi:YdeI/OmpD-associated family protein [Candidatus Saccharibacteria bacterium]|nr:YdeI/OmpD-associated family protein [Candidatus Saccharibacteria bacterium]
MANRKTLLPAGTAHKLPNDLRDALRSDADVVNKWLDITPLARNEFICWVENAKQIKTRARRVRRTCEELQEGKRRPCCWIGCIHRTDKDMSPSQQYAFSNQHKTK